MHDVMYDVMALCVVTSSSVDNQSVDRAYRLGQEKDVMVYRLITCETVEDKMYKRQVSSCCYSTVLYATDCHLSPWPSLRLRPPCSVRCYPFPLQPCM